MNDTTPINILAITGSLREGSLNKGAAAAAVAHAPKDIRVRQAEIGDIPLYNADVQEEGFPPSVARLGRQIAEADAILFVTPEYNYSVPGVLKNAIDWVSRLSPQPFAGKAAGIIGVSPGALGTARAQYHLRQIGVFLDLQFLNRPEVMIGRAGDKFNAEGKLTDQDTIKRIADLLSALADWSQRLDQAGQAPDRLAAAS